LARFVWSCIKQLQYNAMQVLSLQMHPTAPWDLTHPHVVHDTHEQTLTCSKANGQVRLARPNCLTSLDLRHGLPAALVVGRATSRDCSQNPRRTIHRSCWQSSGREIFLKAYSIFCCAARLLRPRLNVVHSETITPNTPQIKTRYPSNISECSSLTS
jgi:hypothetical protein